MIRNRILSDEDVLLILRVAEGLNGSFYRRSRIIAPIFGVSPFTIKAILHGDSHVTLSAPYRERLGKTLLPRKINVSMVA